VSCVAKQGVGHSVHTYKCVLTRLDHLAMLYLHVLIFKFDAIVF